MFRLAVCDDEETMLAVLLKAASQILREEGIQFSIEAFSCAQALLSALNAGKHYHLFLLDIVMDDLDGIALAEEIRRKKRTSPVVFVTGDLTYALRGYEVGAVRYLEKPVQKEKLREALLHCYKAAFLQKKEILLQNGKNCSRVSLDEIYYIETLGRGSRLALSEASVSCVKKLADLEEELTQQGFLRCHQSFLVNLSHVRSIQRYSLQLDNGARVPVSKQRFDSSRSRLLAYLSE